MKLKASQFIWFVVIVCSPIFFNVMQKLRLPYALLLIGLGIGLTLITTHKFPGLVTDVQRSNIKTISISLLTAIVLINWPIIFVLITGIDLIDANKLFLYGIGIGIAIATTRLEKK